MSYLGQVELKSSDIRRVDVTSSTSATHTLTWTPPSEQSLIVTINGIKQQNNYTISGTTLTLDTALIVTDELEVVGILDIGVTNIPADDSITTAMVKDDAVTADKLADAINTSIAANTAKVTNATHTGDVTGATGLTIADNAVNLAKLEDGTQGDILYYGASGAPTRLGFGTSGDFLKTQGTGANPAWATVSAGIKHSSTWILTSNFTGDADPIASNLAELSYGGYGRLGSAMTESSGVFTFPETGIWLITFKPTIYSGASGTFHALGGNIKTTIDDGTWVNVAWTYGSAVNDGSGYGEEAGVPQQNFQFDVTSTSTHKVSFRIQDTGYSSNFTVQGSSEPGTYFSFLRLGDT